MVRGKGLRIQREQLVMGQLTFSLLAVALFLLPKREVLSQELNDGLSIAEGLLITVVELVEGILEGLVTEFACLAHVLHDLIVEDGEVQGETEADGVASIQTLLSNGASLLVGSEGVSLGLGEALVLGALSDVTAVVTDHLKEEGAGLVVAGLRENTLADGVYDVVTVAVQFLLDAALVVSHGSSKLGVLGVLLNS